MDHKLKFKFKDIETDNKKFFFTKEFLDEREKVDMFGNHHNLIHEVD
jgi:hypothetical protein